MKRSGPPKRRTPLARTVKPLKRAWMKRNPTRRREDRRLPGATGWTQRVFALYGRECVACGDRAVQAHHAVPRQRILADTRKTQEERAQLAYDARNGVPVCARCHELHERGVVRIPRAKLPRGVIDWAREYGWAHVLKPPVYP